MRRLLTSKDLGLQRNKKSAKPSIEARFCVYRHLGRNECRRKAVEGRLTLRPSLQMASQSLRDCSEAAGEVSSMQSTPKASRATWFESEDGGHWRHGREHGTTHPWRCEQEGAVSMYYHGGPMKEP